MKTAFTLQLPDGRHLAHDYKTWVENVADAHWFIPGAALNHCLEEFRHLGAKTVQVVADAHRIRYEEPSPENDVGVDYELLDTSALCDVLESFKDASPKRHQALLLAAIHRLEVLEDIQKRLAGVPGLS